MRTADIKTIKKAHQTVNFANILKTTESALFLQLSSNSQDHFVSLVASLKKMGFFISTSLVKTTNTLSIFKSVVIVFSINSKSWVELDNCTKVLQSFYPMAVVFLIKNGDQFISTQELTTLCKLEKQPYSIYAVNTLLDPFLNSLLYVQQQPFNELLHWLDTK